MQGARVCRGGGGGGVWGHPSPKNFIVISGNNLWRIVFFSFLYFICNLYQNKTKCRPRKKWGKREKAPSSLNPPSLNSLNVFWKDFTISNILKSCLRFWLTQDRTGILTGVIIYAVHGFFWCTRLWTSLGIMDWIDWEWSPLTINAND